MFAVDRKRRRVLRLRKAELLGNLSGLRLLNRANGTIGRGYRENTV